METLEARNKEHTDSLNSMGITNKGDRVSFWLRCSVVFYISSMAVMGQHCNSDTVGLICNCSGGKSFLISIISFLSFVVLSSIIILSCSFFSVPLVVTDFDSRFDRRFQKIHHGKGRENRRESYDLLGIRRIPKIFSTFLWVCKTENHLMLLGWLLEILKWVLTLRRIHIIYISRM